MRVCLILSEIFAYGKIGGYGSMARMLAKGLTDQGLDVIAVVPQRSGQRPLEIIDGYEVVSFPGWRVLSKSFYQGVEADIFHSFEASIATKAAMNAVPHRKHLVTCIDPWEKRDWWIEFKYDIENGFKRGLVYPFLWGYYSPTITKKTVQRANAVFSQARYLIPKVKDIYQLKRRPVFLPNPFPVPKRDLTKSEIPLICFIGRLDPRKRPEIYFELAKRFPKCQFVVVGKAHNSKRDDFIRRNFSDINNLRFEGFVDQYNSDLIWKTLETSWILVNTSAREGLPVTYIEAAAYQCAILSAVDADGFASRGGFHVKGPLSTISQEELGGVGTDVDNFVEGLSWLLASDRWREKGLSGYKYVKETHDMGPVLQDYIEMYKKEIGNHND